MNAWLAAWAEIIEMAERVRGRELNDKERRLLFEYSAAEPTRNAELADEEG